jgi:hypothetical protein
VQPNYLTDESDQKAMVAVVRMARRVLQAPAFAAHYVDEVFPGNEVQTDDEILDFSRRRGGTVYHHNGTARMGPDTDPMAVVDARLQVRPHRPARGRRLRHASPDLRRHQRGHHHDRGEGVGDDPGGWDSVISPHRSP